MVDAVRNQGISFSQLIKPYTKYYQTNDLMIEVSNKKIMMAAIEEWAKADAAEVVVFDGLTVSYSDVWYVVKESVTEDALNIMVESTYKRIAETKLKNILSFMALQVA